MSIYFIESGDETLTAGSSPRLNKRFLEGTHRLCTPEETLERISPHLPAMGITRIADVTGLDLIGIPVCMTVRPNSRSLSVSQGKGVTLDLAKASAAMESIESYHAEHIDLPVIRTPFRKLNETGQLAVDPARLMLFDPTAYHPDLDLFWVKSTELFSGQGIWVPYDAVCTDFTTPAEGGIFRSSNGLASGNHLMEAISHAICEVVERDATAFSRLDPNKSIKPVHHESIDSEAYQLIFSAIHKAGLELSVWNITHKLGYPTFESWVIDPTTSSRVSQSKVSGGFGTHLSKEVALLRAVTEAIQSRLTYITGSRDDMNRSEYLFGEFGSFQEIARKQSNRTPDRPAQDYAKIPSLETDSLDLDVQRQLELLKKNGIDQVLMVDLTKPEFDIPVVRVVIPGMEFHPITDLTYHNSERAANTKLEQIMEQLEELIQ